MKFDFYCLSSVKEISTHGPAVRIIATGFLNPEDGTDRLYRNVGKKVPLLAV